MCNFFLVRQKRKCLKKAIHGMQNCRIHSKSEPADVGDCGKGGCHHVIKVGRFCRLKANGNDRFCKRHVSSKQVKFEDCCICYEPLCVSDLPLSCGHVVHMECQISSGQDRCPLCRAKLVISKTVRNQISKCRRSLAIHI
jgi:hypothetical protein